MLIIASSEMDSKLIPLKERTGVDVKKILLIMNITNTAQVVVVQIRNVKAVLFTNSMVLKPVRMIVE